ncbi:uncharacterized conserved protein [Kitasatospora sp. Ki12]
MATERKKILLRLDPSVHDALARWAADDLRSTNAQIEFLLRRALTDASRMPSGADRLPRRGRPPKESPAKESPAKESLPKDGSEPDGSTES